jgi:hypothetical protein
MQRLKHVFTIDIETCPDCGCLADENPDGAGDASAACAVRKIPLKLV